MNLKKIFSVFALFIYLGSLIVPIVPLAYANSFDTNETIFPSNEYTNKISHSIMKHSCEQEQKTINDSSTGEQQKETLKDEKITDLEQNSVTKVKTLNENTTQNDQIKNSDAEESLNSEMGDVPASSSSLMDSNTSIHDYDEFKSAVQYEASHMFSNGSLNPSEHMDIISKKVLKVFERTDFTLFVDEPTELASYKFRNTSEKENGICTITLVSDNLISISIVRSFDPKNMKTSSSELLDNNPIPKKDVNTLKFRVEETLMAVEKTKPQQILESVFDFLKLKVNNSDKEEKLNKVFDNIIEALKITNKYILSAKIIATGIIKYDNENSPSVLLTSCNIFPRSLSDGCLLYTHITGTSFTYSTSDKTYLNFDTTLGGKISIKQNLLKEKIKLELSTEHILMQNFARYSVIFNKDGTIKTELQGSPLKYPPGLSNILEVQRAGVSFPMVVVMGLFTLYIIGNGGVMWEHKNSNNKCDTNPLIDNGRDDL